MPDSTILILQKEQFEQIYKMLKPDNQNLLNPQLVTLIAATLGAFIALISQFLISYYNSIKDKKKLKIQLKAEERRLSFLIIALYKQLAIHRVRADATFRSFQISTDQPVKDDNYKKHIDESYKFEETEYKIKLATSEYFKIITEYTSNFNSTESIMTNLKKLREYNPQSEKYEFVSSNTSEELQVAMNYTIKSQAIPIYIKCQDIFDVINSEMI